MSRSVDIYIAGNIVYVSGTVNGVAYVWTLTGDHTWSTEVARDTNDVYVVAIEAINSAGTVKSISTTVYYGLHLITDRTGGYYNATDLNRVGAAVSYLADKLAAAGYLVAVTAKADWTTADISRVDQMTTYLADVASIRAALAVRLTTPPTPPDMDYLTVEEANDIERILADVDRLASNMVDAYHYSGELFSGEV